MVALTNREAANGLTKLNWVAQEWPEPGRRQLTKALSSNPSRMMPLALEVAIESGDPIGQIAARLLETNPDVELARALEGGIPERTTALRELAAAVGSILYTEAAGSDEDNKVARARYANNLSIRLADLGRREEALAAIEEAVEIRRALAAARPDAYRPDLAMSLNTLSLRLADLGQREEALAAVEEAAEVYRALAAARPDAFRPDLATSLNNLSLRLADLGRREEALAAIEDAVEVYRALAAARPDAFRPDLATSLGARGGVLRDLGRHTGAAETFAEGIRTIAPMFMALPEAFAGLAADLLRDYVDSAREGGLEPDADLLGPIVEKLVEIGAIERQANTGSSDGNDREKGAG